MIDMGLFESAIISKISISKWELQLLLGFTPMIPERATLDNVFLIPCD